VNAAQTRAAAITASGVATNALFHYRIGEMRCHVRSSRSITDPVVASANASPDATKVPAQASFHDHHHRAPLTRE